MSPIRQEHPLSKKPNAKRMRAETAFLGKRLLGIFPNRNMTVIVMMECYRRWMRKRQHLLLYRMSRRFSTGFFIFFRFFWRNHK